MLSSTGTSAKFYLALPNQFCFLVCILKISQPLHSFAFVYSHFETKVPHILFWFSNHEELCGQFLTLHHLNSLTVSVFSGVEMTGELPDCLHDLRMKNFYYKNITRRNFTGDSSRHPFVEESDE